MVGALARRRGSCLLPGLVGWATAVLLQAAPARAHEHPIGMPVPGATADALTATAATYSRDERPYQIPDVTLRDGTGAPVPLRQLLGRRMPTLLQFIFTTCTTVCPIMGATFAGIQEPVDALGIEHQLVSISIDPEHDVPEVLAGYARSLGAEPRWRFLTGSTGDITRVLQAFDSEVPGGSKMYHRPASYLRASGAGPWIRLGGLLTAEELIAEYRRLIEPGRPW